MEGVFASELPCIIVAITDEKREFDIVAINDVESQVARVNDDPTEVVLDVGLAASEVGS